MAEFLSDAWVRELDAAARAAEDLGTERPVVLETLVRDHDRRETGYQVRLGVDGASVTSTQSETSADVVLVTDLETAWGLHQGTVRAQDAFARGDLKLRGRPELLAGRGDLFDRLDRALASVRARTTAPGAR
jgi:hypothetical protein